MTKTKTAAVTQDLKTYQDDKVKLITYYGLVPREYLDGEESTEYAHMQKFVNELEKIKAAHSKLAEMLDTQISEVEGKVASETEKIKEMMGLIEKAKKEPKEKKAEPKKADKKEDKKEKAEPKKAEKKDDKKEK